MAENRPTQKILNSIYGTPNLPITVFGKLFRHPLGLAAGFDKSAQAIGAWPALGFSWVEYGGVTRYPQEGNAKLRMFRSNKDYALINRMGFNNPGAQKIRDTPTKRQILVNGRMFLLQLILDVLRQWTMSVHQMIMQKHLVCCMIMQTFCPKCIFSKHSWITCITGGRPYS